MKKRFTLLSAMMIATSLSFAQNFPTGTIAKVKPSKISESTLTQENNVFTAKAGGDVIWDDDFSTPGIWTIGNTGTGVQGAWTIGAYPAQMTQYMGAMASGTAPVAAFNGIQHLLAAPGVPVGIQNSYVESETIDMSASSVITVTFNQRYRRFNSDATYLEVSKDNGTTWMTFQLNSNVTKHASATENIVSYDVSIGAGVTQGKIRFRWECLEADDDFGSGYGWAIDNVEIKEGYANNVALLNFYTVVGTQEIPYSKIPTAQAAQAGNVSFGARAKNTGIDAQDITLNVTSGSYTGASTAVTVVSSAIDTLQILEAAGMPIPTTVGMNIINASLSAATTLDMTTDDVASFSLEVTNSIYALDKYDGTTASMSGSFIGWNGGTLDQEIGNYFEIFEDASVGAIHIGIGNVSTATQGDYVGRNVVGKIWDMTGSQPALLDQTLDYTVKAGDFGKVAKVTMITPVLLEAGKLYLVTAASAQDAEVPVAFAGSTIAGNVGGFNAGNLTGLAPDDALGRTAVCPLVRLDFQDYTGVQEIAAQYELNVYPNPFSSNTEVAFELKNDANVSINVTDITGRTVSTVDSQMYTSGAHTVSVNGTNLTAGVYNCTITIGNNVITKRIVKK